MKLANIPPAVAIDRTNTVRNHIEGRMAHASSRSHSDSYASEGFGRGFNWETRNAKWDLQMGADGKPKSYVEHEVYDDQHLTAGYHRITDSSYQRHDDGSQVFTMRNWSKGTGLVSDKTETVRVDAAGKQSYDVEDNSPVVSNALRQNRYAVYTASMLAGGLAAGVAGYFLGGATGAALAAPVGAKIFGSATQGFLHENRDADHSQFDRNFFEISDKLEMVSTVGTIASVVGLAAIMARA